MAIGDTAHLLGAALAQDAKALGELMERLRPRIVLWAATRLSPALKAQVEPEDVAQLVLLAIHRDFASFAGNDQPSFLAWVFSIAEHRVQDLARHFGAAKRSLEGMEMELAEARAEVRSFTQTSPSEVAGRNEALAQMHAALATLPERHQTVLRMRDLEMRSYEVIAQRMGLASIGAARTLRCRALVDLRQAMEKGKGE
ncbi:MAG: RNA polymerase sigma factor [Planctomycetota bacterium]